MKSLKGLWQAFVDAFWEGFSLYFSPFTGFWQALGKHFPGVSVKS
jgi:hypothetical protein